jgi:hypothetical protein
MPLGSVLLRFGMPVRFTSPRFWRRSMPTLSDCLPTHVRWEVATRTIPPAHLAQTFAAELGQFYDRGEFDALARRVHALYVTRDLEQGGTFRTWLDRRLHDRTCAPVAWETAAGARLAAR